MTIVDIVFVTFLDIVSLMHIISSHTIAESTKLFKHLLLS